MTDDKQSGHSAQASKAQDSKAQDAAVVPPENANIMPGGSLNTAGGKMREAGVIDAVKTIRLSELAEVHQKPCVRESFMTGIGAGFGVGSLRAVLGAPVFTACNWAVGSFIFGSFLMHEYCQRKRALERQGMKRAVEVIDRKRVEKRLELQSSSEEKKKAAETN